MSSDRTGRRAASGISVQACPEASPSGVEAHPEVLEFIRFCYRRRGYGWPELYDDMCAAAARGSYRGMDYEQLASLGIGFSLGELPRLAALAQRVVDEERSARQARPQNAPADPRRDDLPGTATGLAVAPAG